VDLPTPSATHLTIRISCRVLSYTKQRLVLQALCIARECFYFRFNGLYFVLKPMGCGFVKDFYLPQHALKQLRQKWCDFFFNPFINFVQREPGI